MRHDDDDDMMVKLKLARSTHNKGGRVRRPVPKRNRGQHNVRQHAYRQRIKKKNRRKREKVCGQKERERGQR